MALPILDGNQSATTLSSILTSGEHIPAHTVVSLGTQAITDISGAVSGSVVSISNFPATQTIAGTVTASLAPQANGPVIEIDSPIPNDPKYAAIVGGFDTGAGECRALKLGSSGGIIVQELPAISGTVTVGNSVTIGSLPAISGTVTANLVQEQLLTAFNSFQGFYDQAFPVAIDQAGFGDVPISGTVTLGVGTAQIGSVTASISNSVTIGSLPAISGTVTANGGDGTFLVGGLRFGNKTALTLDGGTGYLQTKVESLPALVAGTAQIGSVTASISGTVPISISSVTVGNSVTIGSLPLIAGTVTVGNSLTIQSGNISIEEVFGENSFVPISGTVTVGNSVTIASFATSVTARLINPAGTAVTYAEVGTAGNPSIDVLSVQGVTSGTAIAISGTVTANSSNGSLTTRFGSVTTANTAFATSAVTNANRKYLLIQNITTASNVITVGIGFTPTTTQGIQLSSGAGLTFEGSYIPTGAVNLLSSVTASCFTILEA